MKRRRQTRLLSALLVAVGTLGLAPAAEAASYGVTEGSQIVYHVFHPMHDVRGASEDVHGRISFEELSPEGVTNAAGDHLEVAWKTFDSGNANRDANVLETVNARKYPKVFFVIEGFPELAVPGTTATGVVRGRLYINGVKRPVTAPIRVDLADPERIEVEARFDVRMTAFDLERPELLFIPTEDRVTIEADLVLRRIEGGSDAAVPPQ